MFNVVRVWIISHGTPYAVVTFQQTPDKILVFFQALAHHDR